MEAKAKIVKGHFFFVRRPEGHFFAQKMPDGVASSVRFGIMAVGGKLHVSKTAAVAVPNATAAVFLRYKTSASSRAREEAAKAKIREVF